MVQLFRSSLLLLEPALLNCCQLDVTVLKGALIRSQSGVRRRQNLEQLLVKVIQLDSELGEEVLLLVLLRQGAASPDFRRLLVARRQLNARVPFPLNGAALLPGFVLHKARQLVRPSSVPPFFSQLQHSRVASRVVPELHLPIMIQVLLPDYQVFER